MVTSLQPWTPHQCPSWEQGGGKPWKELQHLGSASIPAARGSCRLWQGEQGHKGGSGSHGTFPLDSAGAGGGNLCRVSRGGCSQHCSWFSPILAARGFGLPRAISQARSPQLFSSGAFWGTQIPRKAGLFQTPGGQTLESPSAMCIPIEP